jgi:endonuclease YncB( thermonuclease family)
VGTHGGRPGPATGAHHAVPQRPWRARLPLLLAALAGIVLLAVGLVVGRFTAPDARPAAVTAPPTASPAGATSVSSSPPVSHPTSLGQVVRVDSGDEIMVRVDGAEQTVAILGITAPRPADQERTTDECGAAAALTFADQRLSGQMVTLVPDPTVPETDDQGRRLAYVVLASQLNFTDAALQAGVDPAATSMNLWYAPVFAREQDDAVRAGRGLWGAPCRATPGEPLPVGK